MPASSNAFFVMALVTIDDGAARADGSANHGVYRLNSRRLPFVLSGFSSHT